MKIYLHAFEPSSRANGPGMRAVAWLQGCTIGCPGCFNPQTHDPGAGDESETEALAAKVAVLSDIDGLSISGGEPFQQPEALLDLVQRLRCTPLSMLVFSGYTIDHIRALPLGPEILTNIDVLIAGPYVSAKHLGQGLLGSSNQRIHLLSKRHQIEEFAVIPRREVILHKGGTITLTGIDPLRMSE